MTTLTSKRCRPCEGGIPPLKGEEAKLFLDQLPPWQMNGAETWIERTFTFVDFHRTMAFVNAVAWIAHQEDHHPELTISYKECRVRFSTHAIGGLSENDFICAAKVEGLLLPT
ncbi:MAG: 4a-hydroxytetrahydrobiopterin dehydratase [Magnetococcales bacterium]|nr:4a-hydroxytetrahydrobiopterin dehydratase [Magnetococcales bacterium]